ncbi:MAG: Abi family protein [Culicoidibacterales bacterium]
MNSKPFLNLDEQIALLESRGLIISEHSSAKKMLLANNYYYLVNGYSEFLFDFDTNRYCRGATFKDLVSIHGYDKDIKFVLQSALIRAESFIGSVISHVFCEAYGGGYSYLNITNFSNHGKQKLDVAIFIAACSKLIKNNDKQMHIKHYLANHGEVPLWVVINHFEFGLLARFFKMMKDTERAKVTKIINSHLKDEFDISTRINPKQLDTYLYNLRMVRNICAHDNRILKTRLHALPENADVSPTGHDTALIFSHVLIMKCFLSAGQYEILIKSLKNRTKNLDRNLNKSANNICANDISSSLGFPPDWHKS